MPAERLDRRPTRANIEREFRRLADRAGPGDQVFVLLAGHGDCQPESDPPHPLHPEPDGIAEVFLPADVRPAVAYCSTASASMWMSTFLATTSPPASMTAPNETP